VAVPPVTVEVLANEGGTNGDAEAMTLTFESDGISQALVASLRESFARVTPLAAAPGREGADASGWLQAAQAAGADLVLDAVLIYDPRLTTSLNDRFWLNMPLFALGGPGTWFVADRSYHCKVRLEVRVFDLALAASAPGVLDATSQARVTLLRIERQVDEASLSLVERGSTGDFFLSVLVPAGFVGTEAEAAPTETRRIVTDRLCAVMNSALLERADDLARIARVDFHAEGVRVESADGARHLVGEFVLQIGTASHLGELRYRIDDGAFAAAPWGEVRFEAPTARARGRKHYPFRIPVGAAATVQLEVEQLDLLASKRTFTYPVTHLGQEVGS
jgi:hypothetical protein